MKIFRWLLSNVILILLVVAVIYGYMFWGNLVGDDTPAGKAVAYLSSEFVEVEEFIDAIKAKQAKLSGEQKESIPASTDTAQLADSAAATTVTAEVNIESKQAPVNVAQVYNKKSVEQKTVEHLPAIIKVPSASLVTANPATTKFEAGASVTGKPLMSKSVIAKPSKGAFVTAEIEQQLKNVDDQGKVIDEAVNEVLQQELVRNTWVAARKSFFQREYELSEKNYQKVIDNTTDNYDAYGELGNVYFNQGKNQQAASAYFEAASILLRKGEVRRARSLVGLMRQLDKVKASELQALIDSEKS